MVENRTAASPVAAISRTAARLSLAAAAAFLVMLAALHLIKPEVDPAWQMISEYEIGRHGWIMVLAFLSLASSCVRLSVAIRSQVRTVSGKIGVTLLMISAAGMTIAAVFTTDPITASQDELTTHGKLHGLGFLLGIPSFPIAATLVSRSLVRDRAWSPARQALLWAAVLPWIGVLGFVLSVAFLLPRGGGEFGPDVPIGLPNRFLIVAYSVWLMMVAWQVIRVRGHGAWTSRGR
jgi:Protein of unknown function (DUF998)